MDKTTSTASPVPGHGPAVSTGSSSAVSQTTLEHNQQAIPSTLGDTILQPARPPSPRPISRLDSAGVSVASLREASVPRTNPTRLRRCWEVAQGIAVWVAIAFTIASFVRDYMDITKDGGLSTAEDKWKLHNSFRSSCEEDRKAGRRSDACDRELSMPVSPPPGLYKRASQNGELHSRFKFGDHEAQWALTLVVLAMMTVISSVRKRFSRSHDATPKGYLAKDASTSTEEWHVTQTQSCDHEEPPESASTSLKRRRGFQPTPSDHSEPDRPKHAPSPTEKRRDPRRRLYNHSKLYLVERTFTSTTQETPQRPSRLLKALFILSNLFFSYIFVVHVLEWSKVNTRLPSIWFGSRLTCTLFFMATMRAYTRATPASATIRSSHQVQRTFYSLVFYLTPLHDTHRYGMES